MHRKYHSRKSKLFRDHPQVIVEIGAGYGANFRYLKPGTKVIAIEPKESLHNILKERASHFNIELVVYKSCAEDMPVDDSSAEMVMSSLVLCSVKNPNKAVSEIRRILKPNGKFMYLEHVKAHDQPMINFLQRSVKTPWKCFFDGCHVTRDTSTTIEKAGFTKIEEEAFNLRTFFIPIIPHITGVAVK